MQPRKMEYGPLEAKLLGWVQMTGRQAVLTRQVSEVLRIPPVRASGLLDRMARSGIATQLMRGFYLLPEELPTGGQWQPPVELAVWYYLEEKGARWQETGLAAFNFHGLSEQVANVLTVYNDKVSERREFGRLEALFIKVGAPRLGSTVEVPLESGRKELRRIGTLARVVFDAVYDYNRFGTLPKAYEWISQRRNDVTFLRELVGCAIKYGNVATRRRLGWFMEKTGASARTTSPLRKSLSPTSSLIPADPIKPARGQVCREWGVLDNYDDKEAENA